MKTAVIRTYLKKDLKISTKMKNNLLGAEGEQVAADYIAKKGYTILERNWRYKHKEIDIIAKTESYIVVIEVKTRAYDYFELPQDAVTKQKQKFLVEAANAYIIEHDIEKEARFDIIAVVINSKNTKIEHLENAFYPLA